MEHMTDLSKVSDTRVLLGIHRNKPVLLLSKFQALRLAQKQKCAIWVRLSMWNNDLFRVYPGGRNIRYRRK